MSARKALIFGAIATSFGLSALPAQAARPTLDDPMTLNDADTILANEARTAAMLQSTDLPEDLVLASEDAGGGGLGGGGMWS